MNMIQSQIPRFSNPKFSDLTGADESSNRESDKRFLLFAPVFDRRKPGLHRIMAFLVV
jgi:hypothetical protein